MFNKTSLALV